MGRYLEFIRIQSSQDVQLGSHNKWRKGENGGNLLDFYLSSWQITPAQNPGALWSWDSHKPLSLPHCAINLTTWHCVSNPHHLAQPTSPTLPPTATLHLPYFPITTVFQSAGSCSQPQIPSLLFLYVQIPGILHRPWRMPPVLKDSWLFQQEGTECQPLYFYFSHHIAPPLFVWGARIHISGHYLNFKLKKKIKIKKNQNKKTGPHIYPYMWEALKLLLKYLRRSVWRCGRQK